MFGQPAQPAEERAIVLVHRDHAGAGAAKERSVGEAKPESGSEPRAQGAALQGKDSSVNATTVKAEYAREVKSWVLCSRGHGQAS